MLELSTCDEARQLLQRPLTFRDCIVVPSTAQVFGWYNPSDAIRRRIEAVFGKGALEKAAQTELR